jgi:type IV pilus assembly protein PilE
MVYRTARRFSARHSGFTLVELLIVVVIAAILVSIAVPSYQAQVRKSRRTDARNAMLDIAGREERFLSVTNNYSALPTDVGYGGALWPQNVTNNYYQVRVDSPDTVNQPGVFPSYLITATPIGIQVGDTACATFTVNQIGQQIAKTLGGVDNSTTCWGI